MRPSGGDGDPESKPVTPAFSSESFNSFLPEMPTEERPRARPPAPGQQRGHRHRLCGLPLGPRTGDQPPHPGLPQWKEEPPCGLWGARAPGQA